MKLTDLIEPFIASMESEGRLNSKRSEQSYRAALVKHAELVGNQDPRQVSREGIKRTLSLWRHPNTQARQRSMLNSFYRWLMEEGLRRDNPVEQTRRPRQRKPQVYRLTLEEIRALLSTARTTRERRLVYLGLCAGLRREELRLLQGRHFAREGFVWVSKDIAKGGHQRWVPVISELAPIVAEIRSHVDPGHYVFPAQQFSDPGRNELPQDRPELPTDGKTLWRITKKLGKRAGIAAEIGTHTLRHGFGDHVARSAGLMAAQALMGHASIETTRSHYVGPSTLDELAESVSRVTFAGGEVSPLENGPRGREWRRWESNPRREESGTGVRLSANAGAVEAASDVLRLAFASPVLRCAAKGMA